MEQLNDFQRFFITSLKTDKPEWCPKTMRKKLPKFFETISLKQVKTVLTDFKEGFVGRKDGSGRRNVDKTVEEEALKLLQSDKAQKGDI